MRISDWSSDVCSSDLHIRRRRQCDDGSDASSRADSHLLHHRLERWRLYSQHAASVAAGFDYFRFHVMDRSEEHTSELQSLMRISYAVFCLKKKKNQKYKSVYNYNI